MSHNVYLLLQEIESLVRCGTEIMLLQLLLHLKSHLVHRVEVDTLMSLVLSGNLVTFSVFTAAGAKFVS